MVKKVSEIYLADRECKVNASEALQEIDKQYLGWGWNTEQTTLDLVDYAKDLERQLAEAREAIGNVLNITYDSEGVAGYHDNGDVALWSEFEDIQGLEEQLKE